MDAQRSKCLTQGHPFVGSREAVPGLSPPDSLSRTLPITPPKAQDEGHQIFPRDAGPSGLRGFTLKSLLFQWANNAQGGSLLTVPSWGCREEFTTFPTLGLLLRLRGSVRKGLVILTPSRYLFPHTVVYAEWGGTPTLPQNTIKALTNCGPAACRGRAQGPAELCHWQGTPRPLTALLTGVKHCPCIGDSLIINCYSFLLYF